MFVFAYGYVTDAKYISHILEKYPNLKVFSNKSLNKAFVVYPGKYLTMQSNDITEVDSKILSINKTELEQLQKPFGTELPKIYLFQAQPQVAQPQLQPQSQPQFQAQKLRIITFNLAYAVQANKVQGSEQLLVQLCQDTYKGGNSKIEGLSQCTLNAAEWLARQNADLIGLQEIGDKSYVHKMLTVFPKGYDMIRQSPQTVYFIYNKVKLGPATVISPPNLTVGGQGRPMIMVWFPKVQLLAVNIHAAHGLNLQREIEKAFNSVNIPNNIRPQRIIVTGDFNDDTKVGQVTLNELNLMGQNLKQHGQPPKTCCTDSGYKYYGDYILDTEYKQPGFYGVPNDAKSPIAYNGNTPYLNHNSTNKLMSDHEPVVFYPN